MIQSYRKKNSLPRFTKLSQGKHPFGKQICLSKVNQKADTNFICMSSMFMESRDFEIPRDRARMVGACCFLCQLTCITLRRLHMREHFLLQKYKAQRYAVTVNIYLIYQR